MIEKSPRQLWARASILGTVSAALFADAYFDWTPFDGTTELVAGILFAALAFSDAAGAVSRGRIAR